MKRLILLLVVFGILVVTPVNAADYIVDFCKIETKQLCKYNLKTEEFIYCEDIDE